MHSHSEPAVCGGLEDVFIILGSNVNMHTKLESFKGVFSEKQFSYIPAPHQPLSSFTRDSDHYQCRDILCKCKQLHVYVLLKYTNNNAQYTLSYILLFFLSNTSKNLCFGFFFLFPAQSAIRSEFSVQRPACGSGSLHWQQTRCQVQSHLSLRSPQPGEIGMIFKTGDLHITGSWGG